MNQRIPLALLATRALVPHGQLDLHPDLQVLLYRAGFQQLSPHPVLVPRIIPFRVQDPAFALWISDCSLPISPLCWGLSGGLHSPLEYHPLLPALCHQGTCWAGASAPSSESLMNKLNYTGSSIEPWGTPLVTGTGVCHWLQTLWDLPFNQFSLSPQTVHWSFKGAIEKAKQKPALLIWPMLYISIEENKQKIIQSSFKQLK